VINAQNNGAKILQQTAVRVALTFLLQQTSSPDPGRQNDSPALILGQNVRVAGIEELEFVEASRHV